MDIVIIGTGNAAHILGLKLKAAGHNIVQVYGRNTNRASELAYKLETESTNYWSVINQTADVYLIAVSDVAVADVLKELFLPRRTIVHTAASLSKEVLHEATKNYGVFYPLQSLKKENDNLPDIPIIIDASNHETLNVLRVLASSISEKVIEADDEQRMKLHLAAVLCNNFVNHLYYLTEKYCRQEGLDFKLLLPLIQETAQRIILLSPAAVQTGPAIRSDEDTIQNHLMLLEAHPQLQEIYKVLTQSIKVNK